MAPSAWRPQVLPSPVATPVKSPLGGVDWPTELSPQQVIGPFRATPQLCAPPAATLPASVLGGAATSEIAALPVGGAAASAWTVSISKTKRTRTGPIVPLGAIRLDHIQPPPRGPERDAALRSP